MFSFIHNSINDTILLVIYKNWHMLGEDPILSEVIPEKPKVEFKKCMNIRD